MRMNVNEQLPIQQTKAPHPLSDPQQWRPELDRLIDGSEPFRRISLEVARGIHSRLIGEGQPPVAAEITRQVADLLHGKPFGHPLHPILTDVTIGSWSMGFVFDLLGLVPGFRSIRKAANLLTWIGILSAGPTAIAGIADYSAIKQNAASYGAAHGLLNTAALLCYIRSGVARVKGDRGTALLFGAFGFILITLSSWLGGDLVYRHRVGVNHVPEAKLKDWTPIAAMETIPEAKPIRVEIDDVPLLVFRQGETVHIIGAVCSHAGGPLEEGRVVDGVCIECPWHQSVFDMRDGRVVHSPATYEQPLYEVRVEDGQILARLATPQKSGSERGVG
ncbi:MAG: Rieske 2Fe-2S domain-containing protein [Chloroflexi bacterium]|nr:Rieske 2Fe-2S domain-containing protein [Chloroflexota bacterium]